MPHVPRVSQIRRVLGSSRHAVALAAKSIQFVCRHTSGILRMKPVRLARMAGGGAMAHFAPNAQFARHNVFRGIDAQSPRGMACEAAQDRGGWIENTVPDAAGAHMTRRACKTGERAVPGFTFFQVVFRIQPPDKCDGLLAGSKCPVARLWRLGMRQASRVGAP